MKYFIGLCCLLWSALLFAQPAESEDEIFQVVQEMPLFPACKDSTGTKQELRTCADKKMLEFIYSNIQYPRIDRVNRNEGTAVVRFVVEKDGSISNPSILKDPGDQLGEEAVRVVELMGQLPEKWIPGKQDGKPVRVYYTLPVKFKVQLIEEPDYVISGGDSIWVKIDTPAAYENGDQTLKDYLEENLVYPEKGQDSCRIGIIEVSMIIRKDSTVEILNVIDYSNLGIDYQFEAIRLVNATNNQWKPAVRLGREVNTTQSLRIAFRPNFITCGKVINDFNTADAIVDEAALLIQEDKMEEGILKLTEALALFPTNTEYLSLRGETYLKLEKTKEACDDLLKASETVSGNWYDNLLPILCK